MGDLLPVAGVREVSLRPDIRKFSIFLDVYGTCESKPQFVYSAGATSPIGKTSLEPDFLIRYPDRSYKLIEIERLSKNVATAQGQPRAEIAQAVFQCAE
jgi:hypothetical protein